MLAFGQVIDWDTKHPGDRMHAAYANAYFLNTNRMVNIVDYAYGDSDCSKFLFSNNPNDPRDSPDRIAYSLDVDELRAYHDDPYTSNFATLPIFPSLDITNLGTAVDTLVEWDNIAYYYMTWNDYNNDHVHLVYYTESWKRVECIVDENYFVLFLSQFT